MDQVAFWNKAARKYARDPISDMKTYQNGLEEIKGYLNKDAKVVELGAGTSSTALILAPFVHSYISTDSSNEMVKIGQEKLAAQSEVSNLQVEVFNPEREAWRGTQADIVLGLNFLHLVSDVPKVLGAARDMLTDDGILILKSACFSSIQRAAIVPFVWIMRQFGKAPRVNAFSFAQHKAEVEAAGFEIVKAFPAKKGGLGHFVIARKTKR